MTAPLPKGTRAPENTSVRATVKWSRMSLVMVSVLSGITSIPYNSASFQGSRASIGRRPISERSSAASRLQAALLKLRLLLTQDSYRDAWTCRIVARMTSSR